MSEILGNGLLIFTNIYMLLLLGRIALSWMQGSLDRYPVLYNLFRFCHALTEPLLGPLRRLIPPVRIGVGFMDLSPFALWVLLILAQKLIRSLF